MLIFWMHAVEYTQMTAVSILSFLCNLALMLSGAN